MAIACLGVHHWRLVATSMGKGRAVNDADVLSVSGKVWQWRSADTPGAGWHFLTVEGEKAAEIRFAALGRTRGFGSIRVTARIGSTRWKTSLFPHRETGGFILPLKADVRRREHIEAGCEVTVQLAI